MIIVGKIRKYGFNNYDLTKHELFICWYSSILKNLPFVSFIFYHIKAFVQTSFIQTSSLLSIVSLL